MVKTPKTRKTKYILSSGSESESDSDDPLDSIPDLPPRLTIPTDDPLDVIGISSSPSPPPPSSYRTPARTPSSSARKTRGMSSGFHRDQRAGPSRGYDRWGPAPAPRASGSAKRRRVEPSQLEAGELEEEKEEVEEKMAYGDGSPRGVEALPLSGAARSFFERLGPMPGPSYPAQYRDDFDDRPQPIYGAQAYARHRRSVSEEDIKPRRTRTEVKQEEEEEEEEEVEERMEAKGRSLRARISDPTSQPRMPPTAPAPVLVNYSSSPEPHRDPSPITRTSPAISRGDVQHNSSAEWPDFPSTDEEDRRIPLQYLGRIEQAGIVEVADGDGSRPDTPPIPNDVLPMSSISPIYVSSRSASPIIQAVSRTSTPLTGNTSRPDTPPLPPGLAIPVYNGQPQTELALEERMDEKGQVNGDDEEPEENGMSVESAHTVEPSEVTADAQLDNTEDAKLGTMESAASEDMSSKVLVEDEEEEEELEEEVMMAEESGQSVANPQEVEASLSALDAGLADVAEVDDPAQAGAGVDLTESIGDANGEITLEAHDVDMKDGVDAKEAGPREEAKSVSLTITGTEGEEDVLEVHAQTITELQTSGEMEGVEDSEPVAKGKTSLGGVDAIEAVNVNDAGVDVAEIATVKAPEVVTTMAEVGGEDASYGDSGGIKVIASAGRDEEAGASASHPIAVEAESLDIEVAFDTALDAETVEERFASPDLPRDSDQTSPLAQDEPPPAKSASATLPSLATLQPTSSLSNIPDAASPLPTSPNLADGQADIVVLVDASKTVGIEAQSSPMEVAGEQPVAGSDDIVMEEQIRVTSPARPVIEEEGEEELDPDDRDEEEEEEAQGHTAAVEAGSRDKRGESSDITEANTPVPVPEPTEPIVYNKDGTIRKRSGRPAAAKPEGWKSWHKNQYTYENGVATKKVAVVQVKESTGKKGKVEALKSAARGRSISSPVSDSSELPPAKSNSKSATPSKTIPAAEEAGEDDYDDDDDDEVYCPCGKPSRKDGNDVLVGCDGCDIWFHAGCVNLSEENIGLVDTFYCPDCEKSTGKKTTLKRVCKRDGCEKQFSPKMTKFCSPNCAFRHSQAIVAGMENKKQINQLAKALASYPSPPLDIRVTEHTSLPSLSDSAFTPYDPIDSLTRRIESTKALISILEKRILILGKATEQCDNLAPLNPPNGDEAGKKKRKPAGVEDKPCGWVEALIWGDEEVEKWEAGMPLRNVAERDGAVLPEGEDVIMGEGEGQEEAEVGYCVNPRKRCDRHSGWQKTIPNLLDTELSQVQETLSSLTDEKDLLITSAEAKETGKIARENLHEILAVNLAKNFI